MHSSISNFNRRVPELPYRNIGLTVFFVSLLFLFAWYKFWRVEDIIPPWTDNAELWAYTRQQVPANDKSALVAIGSSRMQLGLRLDTFKEVGGIKPIQLAIIGQSPIPVLRHFSEDESFRGTIMSFPPAATTTIW